MVMHSTRDAGRSLVKAVFLDYDTVSAGDLDASALRATVDDLLLCDTDDSATLERIRGAEIVLLNKIELSRELLEGSPRLQLIAVAGTGTNNIDVAAARELGIAVCNVRAYCTSSVVQHVWALILSLNQHVCDYSRLARDGSWTRNEGQVVLAHPIRELSGRLFGVVGWGELGRGAARMAEAFGMRVIVANRRGESPEAGPCGAGTAARHVGHRFAALPARLFHARPDRRARTRSHEAGRALINTARGALVDGHALERRRSRRIVSAAPVSTCCPRSRRSKDDPLLDPGIPNLIIDAARGVGGARGPPALRR